MYFKKLIVFFLFSWLSFVSAQAQFIPVNGEWLHFSYSKLTLLNTPPDLVEKWNSQGWQLMFMRETRLGLRSHFAFAYGLGFSTNYWHTNLNIKTLPQGGISYQYLPTDSTYKTNRFSANYIDLPIEFRYRSKSNHKGRYFRLYVGGLVGYKINSFSEFKESNYNVKFYKITDLASWHYGVFVRTGFWLFNLYAYYGLNPVFSDIKVGNAPEGLGDMHSFSLGLSISL